MGDPAAPPWRSSGAGPGALGASLDDALADWNRRARTRRLWQGDSSLWTSRDENLWLGWLDVEDGRRQLRHLEAVATQCLEDRPTSVLLLGMGGSSLAAEMLATTFPPARNRPRLHVVDSTVPAQVLRAERAVDMSRALVVVASKSGSTLEPALLMDRAWEQVSRALGSGTAGSRFVAITDPGSGLEREARQRGFRHVVHGREDVGGRYSALTAFGMLPACLVGADVDAIMGSAERMAEACRSEGADNPGVALGVALATLARGGRDKVTLSLPPAIAALGPWIEQLVAESTGKQGKGLVPVVGERVDGEAPRSVDRVLVHVDLAGHEDDRALACAAWSEAGHPVLRWEVATATDLGAEILRWEIATAVAGSVLGIHAFDQPDVESAKVAAREAMAQWESTGAVSSPGLVARQGRLSIHAGDQHAARLAALAGSDAPATAVLAAHLGLATAGDYAAILAFLDRSPELEAALEALREDLRSSLGVATTLGFGPRFLHSTGQLHVGGPASGLFLQVVAGDPEDARIPGRRHGFAVVKDAQAAGNLAVLDARERRALRVHLGPDVASGLEELRALVRAALSSRRTS